MPIAEKPFLYERLRGVYSIASVVDDFRAEHHQRVRVGADGVLADGSGEAPR